ncbi:MAG: GreA/GreB family elongation factor [bacterium]
MAIENTQATEANVQWDEAGFLKQIEVPHIDVEGLIAALGSLRAAGGTTQAESRAELLQDTLQERKLIDHALRVMELRISWQGPNTPLTESWQQELLDVLGLSWEQKTLIEQISGGKIVSAREYVRRILLVRSLHPGVLCFDKTWGLGVVTNVDFYYARVEIDFERKLGHQLSFAYASETLTVIGPDHILAWKHRKKEDLKQLVEKNAADVVLMALRSFGPIPLPQLQTMLVPGIVAESDWKRFWDSARKDLKKNPQVFVPAVRTQNLCILTEDQSRGDDWYALLAKERDLVKVVTRFEELTERKTGAVMTDSDRKILTDRFAFVVKGATQKNMGLAARIWAAAKTLGIDTTNELGKKDGSEFFSSSTFQQTIKQIPVRSMRPFLTYLESLDRDRTRSLLAQLISALELSSLNEVISYLLDTGAEQDCIQAFRKAADNRNASVEMLHWISRSMDRIQAWSLGHPITWVVLMLDVLESEYNGERLKAQNQLRERFSRAVWLRETLAQLDDAQRRQVVQRLRDTKGWQLLDRQSAIGQILKLYPELQDMMVAKSSEPVGSRGPVTSNRTYEERRAQLQKIISVEIPQVAKDIALARSYGDLRENHEFKAAKEAQTVLLRKRGELEIMLRRVAPTDFEGFPTDQVGMATGVVIDYGDGRTERYYILGEWDTDQSLGIISRDSRMAHALEGRKKGEQVTVPTETGEAVCTITDVTGLPDGIKAWIKGI